MAQKDILFLNRFNFQFLFHVFLILFTYTSLNWANTQQKNKLDRKNINSEINNLEKLFWSNADQNPDSALVIAEHILQLSANNNISLKGKAHYMKGVVLMNMEKYISAREELLKSVDLAKRAGDKKELAFSYENLGKISNWYADYYKSIEYQKKARKLYIELKYIGFPAGSNNLIASQFVALGQYDSAVVYYSDNIRNQPSIHDNNIIIFSYKQIAGLYAKMRHYKLAYRYMLEGIEFAEKTGEEISLANLYFSTGELFINNHLNENIALDYLLESKRLYQKLNENFDVCDIENCIGDAYHQMSKDSLAMDSYKRVVGLIGENDFITLSNTYYKIGMVYKSKNKYDLALAYLSKSIGAICHDCPELNIHNTLIEAAGIYLETNNYRKAYQLLKKAKNIAIQSQTNLETLLSDEALANYFETVNRTDSAFYYYHEAYRRAQKMGLPEKIRNNAKSMSLLLYAKKNFKASSDYMAIAEEMNESLSEIIKSEELSKLEVRLEVAKKEEERKLDALASLNEIKRQKFIRNYSIAGAVFFILMTALLYLAYRSKRKDNKLLASQKKEIEEMAHQLHETDENKLHFFTNISHEIRTPLTLIKSPLERLLQSLDNNSPVQRQLQLALNNTVKLQQITDQILDLRRLDENQFYLKPSKFDLVHFLKEIVHSFEAYCNQVYCTLHLKSNVSSARLMLDGAKLHSMISNLLSNAFKFNKEGGAVRISLQVMPGYFSILVEDTGKGIPKEYLTKLGTRYFQVDNSAFHQQGSGIGLAYVKELTELMKGSLEVSSQMNSGTSIQMYIPSESITILDNAPYSIKIIPQLKTFDNITAGHLSEDPDPAISNSILIVEDNIDLLEFIQSLFSDSFHVYTAKDGTEGMNMAIKNNPCMIISDIMMPGLPGDQLCKILKNDIRTSHIPVILLTAKDSRESQVEGYECGADDYIVKPFDSELLRHKVKNILTTRDNARKQFSFATIENKTYTSISKLDKEFLKRCVELTHKNLSNTSFTVDQFADEIGVSRKTLLRKFKELSGKSPSDFIRYIRMTQAAQLLREKGIRVNEVALMVGYEDSNRFSSAFKQFHGCSPSAYCQ